MAFHVDSAYSSYMYFLLTLRCGIPRSYKYLSCLIFICLDRHLTSQTLLMSCLIEFIVCAWSAFNRYVHSNGPVLTEPTSYVLQSSSYAQQRCFSFEGPTRTLSHSHLGPLVDLQSCSKELPSRTRADAHWASACWRYSTPPSDTLFGPVRSSPRAHPARVGLPCSVVHALPKHCITAQALPIRWPRRPSRAT